MRNGEDNIEIRVAHLHTNHDWGGGENQVLNLVRGLMARGVGTVLLTPPGGMLWHRAREVGIWTEPLDPNSSSGSWRHAREIVKELGVNLLHAHDSGATGIGGKLASKVDVPLVLSRRVASPLRRNPMSRRKYSPSRISAVLAISETVKRVFCESGYPADRVWVVPSGLDVAALDRCEVDRELREKFGKAPLIGGVGKLSVKKNWKLMIETAYALNARGADFQWILIGDGPEAEQLELLVDSRGLSDRFVMPGFQPDGIKLLKSIDLLFFPSRMEGASVTVREAMALGTPVVAANAEGTVESLDGCGWVIDPDDPDAAADVILSALNDTAEKTRRVTAAREVARSRYSFECTLEGTLAAYRSVLEGSGVCND